MNNPKPTNGHQSSRRARGRIPVVLALLAVGVTGWTAAAQVINIPISLLDLRYCSVSIPGLGSKQKLCKGADEPCLFIIQEGQILIAC